MPEPSTLAVFAVAALALLVVPGPAVMYIVTRSVTQGRAAGLASVAGIHVGTAVHIAAAAAGVSALLVSSAALYVFVKWAGAAYLIALGIRKLLDKRPVFGADGDGGGVDLDVRREPLARVFRQGVVVNVLNPKTALFFFAFLPQFVRPDHGNAALQSFVLGGVFLVLGVLSDGCYAVAGAALGGRLRGNQRWARRFGRASGAVYVGLGVAAAVADDVV